MATSVVAVNAALAARRDARHEVRGRDRAAAAAAPPPLLDDDECRAPLAPPSVRNAVPALAYALLIDELLATGRPMDAALVQASARRLGLAV